MACHSFGLVWFAQLFSTLHKHELLWYSAEAQRETDGRGEKEGKGNGERGRTGERRCEG